MSRILVTGCSGFIGSRIAIEARQAGHEVIASARNPSEVLSLQLGMPVMALDVMDASSRLENDGPIDVIVHCATANDILSRNFETGVNLSVCGTRNLLEFAAVRQIKRIIFLSTLQVYGIELTGQIFEDTPVCCETPYGLNHYFGEEVCRMYARNRGFDVVILRPSNVYGVPDVSTTRRDTLVPMCFVKEAAQTGTITLRSSGRQQRNFVSTSEVARACVHFVDKFPKGCQVVNVSSNWLCEIREIADITKALYLERYGTELQLCILSEEPKTPNRFVIDSTIAHLRPPAADSRRSMINVIRRLFENQYHLVRTAYAYDRSNS